MSEHLVKLTQTIRTLGMGASDEFKTNLQTLWDIIAFLNERADNGITTPTKNLSELIAKFDLDETMEIEPFINLFKNSLLHTDGLTDAWQHEMDKVPDLETQ